MELWVKDWDSFLVLCQLWPLALNLSICLTTDWLFCGICCDAGEALLLRLSTIQHLRRPILNIVHLMVPILNNLHHLRTLGTLCWCTSQWCSEQAGGGRCGTSSCSAICCLYLIPSRSTLHTLPIAIVIFWLTLTVKAYLFHGHHWNFSCNCSLYQGSHRKFCICLSLISFDLWWFHKWFLNSREFQMCAHMAWASFIGSWGLWLFKLRSPEYWSCELTKSYFDLHVRDQRQIRQKC